MAAEIPRALRCRIPLGLEDHHTGDHPIGDPPSPGAHVAPLWREAHELGCVGLPAMAACFLTLGILHVQLVSIRQFIIDPYTTTDSFIKGMQILADSVNTCRFITFISETKMNQMYSCFENWKYYAGHEPKWYTQFYLICCYLIQNDIAQLTFTLEHFCFQCKCRTLWYVYIGRMTSNATMERRPGHSISLHTPQPPKLSRETLWPHSSHRFGVHQKPRSWTCSQEYLHGVLTSSLLGLTDVCGTGADGQGLYS